MRQRPVVIRRREYATTAEAAAELGVTRAAIGMAKMRGRLDAAGTRHGGGKPRVPVTIRGEHYPSISAACAALGVRRGTFEDARRRGRLDYLGTRSVRQSESGDPRT